MADDKKWVKVCRTDEIEVDDVYGSEIEGSSYAVYRLKDRYYATEGLCTHEQAKLCLGYLDGTIIECPKHNARFDITTGRALRKPAVKDLKTYAVKEENGLLYIGLPITG
ncbi:MAG: non-heme iron oxygenase ferredoxin subunit [Spirochaetales bacterium]|nr:MAG: non-heme iron oxygenase ferredoxin subunit [Spirochaetales bacterium]